MKDEGLLPVRLDQPGQLWLLDGGVDMRIFVVLEDAEVAVQADVDARRLDQLWRVRIEADSTGIQLGPDVAVREQHVGNLPFPAEVRCSSGQPSCRARKAACCRTRIRYHIGAGRGLPVGVHPARRPWSAGVVQWQNVSFPS